jgi:hypothetical protein
MNEQNFGEPINTSDNVENNDQSANSPVVNSDPFAEKAPVDAALVNETPMGETVADAGPMDETVAQEAPMGEMVTNEAPVIMKAGPSVALLTREESENLRTRWIEIQGKFVDEPRSAVQQADALVSEVIGKITQIFASEHNSLEGQWKKDIDVSTEDLRKALQQYRSFFNRLVG